ncbi:hypothetical protein OENI_500006 [Oenococcus oeni]|nr:hypothetical protein OENI_500006 [Oenococcus oeni]
MILEIVFEGQQDISRMQIVVTSRRFYHLLHIPFMRKNMSSWKSHCSKKLVCIWRILKLLQV